MVLQVDQDSVQVFAIFTGNPAEFHGVLQRIRFDGKIELNDVFGTARRFLGSETASSA